MTVQSHNTLGRGGLQASGPRAPLTRKPSHRRARHPGPQASAPETLTHQVQGRPQVTLGAGVGGTEGEAGLGGAVSQTQVASCQHCRLHQGGRALISGLGHAGMSQGCSGRTSPSPNCHPLEEARALGRSSPHPPGHTCMPLAWALQQRAHVSS